MKNYLARFLLGYLVFFGSLVHAAEKEIKVFIVGNSLIKAAEGKTRFFLKDVLIKISEGSGVKISVSHQYASNTDLARHWKKGAEKKIQKGNFDWVILQEYSDKPLKDFQGTLNSVMKYKELADKKGAKTLLFLPAGHAPGKKVEHPLRVEDLKTALDKICVKTGATLIPVGLAWQKVLKKNKNINLYNKDGFHPGLPNGIYLNACVLYGAISGKSPVGLGKAGFEGLNDKTVKLLQEMAWETVRKNFNYSQKENEKKDTQVKTENKKSKTPPPTQAEKNNSPQAEKKENISPKSEKKVSTPRKDFSIKFTQAPKASKKGSSYELIFAVGESVDVEVTVLNNKGLIVRHLGAGLLGENSPFPFQKGLSQKITWDGKNDFKTAAEGKPFKFQVSLGQKARLHKIIGFSGKSLARLSGFFCGPDGTFYSMQQGDWVGHRHSWNLLAYDKDLNYKHQVYPGPAGLSKEKREGWPWMKLQDGSELPIVHNVLSRSLYPASTFLFRNFPVVTKTGKIILLGGGKAGSRVNRPDVRGGRRLMTLGTDASVPKNFIGKIVAPSNYGGFGHLTLSPDEKFLYLSGLFLWDKKSKEKIQVGKNGHCNVVWKISLENRNEKPVIFVGKLFEAGNGKDRLNDPQGLSVDKAGNLYVADYANNRIAIFKEDGSYLDEISVNSPDQVKVSKSGAIYVMHVIRKTKIQNTHWYTESRWRFAGVTKYKNLESKTIEAEYKINSGRKAHGGGAFMNLDDSRDKPRIYVGGLAWRNSSIHLLAEKDGKLQLAEKIMGGSNVKREPLGDVGFSGDIAYVAGKLYSSGPSSWGYKGNRWTTFDALTGKFEGLMKLTKGKGIEIFKNMGELVGGKDGLLYLQSSCQDNVVIRVDKSGKGVPFETNGKFAIEGFPYGHARQTGLFVDRFGKIFVPTGVASRKIDPMSLKIVSPSGKILNEKAVEIQGARCAGVAVDNEKNIYLGAQVVSANALLPNWVKGRLPKKGITEECIKTYRMAGSIFKFPPKGGGIFRDANGKYVGIPVRKPVNVTLKNVLWTKRLGLISTHYVGCSCETTRFSNDAFGRIYVPDTLRFSVVVLDTAGNIIERIGSYGNMDSRGQGTLGPEIAFAWPLSAVCGEGKVFVSDLLNNRLVGVRFEHAVVKECIIP
ncbi:MAG: hypothetical protein COA79_23785 [Planctomycetota bacterium]|nr:MAG: hypothetical protein COA79_23785 [Planctomycetota bacterium]